MKSLFVAILAAVFLILGAAAQTSSAQSRRVTVSVDASKTGAPISPYLYGQFIEHIGDLVNRSVWAEMLDDRKFYYPITSTPGEQRPVRGRRPNRWMPTGPDSSVTMDGDRPWVGDHAIGDPDKRPPTWDYVWSAVQPNDVGTDEFLTLCQLLGVDAFISVNAGFGDARSAAQEVEYVNGSADTPMGKLRAANGHPTPYNVKWWGIGNEMYGAWQFGQMVLNQYVIKHNMFAKAMRKVDPTITLLATGATPEEMTIYGLSLRATGKLAPDYGSAGHTMGTASIDFNATEAALNTTGLLFKLYRDHFGTVAVPVDGYSPVPAPLYPVGADQPKVNAGSPTYPVDVSAALTADGKFLTVAVVNPTESAQTLVWTQKASCSGERGGCGA